MRAAVFFSLFFPLFALANPHDIQSHRRHQKRGGLSRLLERGGNRATYYDVGLGACGKTNSANEFVIAISHLNWDGGSHCSKSVSISYQGVTAEATVVDECMGCPWDAIDLSTSLFQHLAGSLAPGAIDIDWSYDGGQPKPSPSPSSSSEKPKPSSTSTTYSSSSTQKLKSSSTGTSTSTMTSTTSTSTTSAAPSPSAAPPTAPAAPQNIADLNELMLSLGQFVLGPWPSQ